MFARQKTPLVVSTRNAHNKHNFMGITECRIEVYSPLNRGRSKWGRYSPFLYNSYKLSHIVWLWLVTDLSMCFIYVSSFIWIAFCCSAIVDTDVVVSTLRIFSVFRKSRLNCRYVKLYKNMERFLECLENHQVTYCFPKTAQERSKTF